MLPRGCWIAGYAEPHTTKENSVQVWPGSPYPLGATYDGRGTNFALFSEVADRVELCLFDADRNETRVELTEGRRVVTGHLFRVPSRVG